MAAPLAALGAIAAIGSSFLNAASTSSLNSATRNWQTEMYREDREYNTPANQVKRLREAGINPQLAMSNGMLGAGSSTMPSAPATHAYDFSPAAQGISRSIDQYQQAQMNKAQIDSLNAQADNQRIKNDYEAWNQYSSIIERLSNIDKNSSEAQFLRKRLDELEIDLETRSEENRERIDNMRSQRYLNNAMERKTRLEADFQDIVNQFEIPNRVKVLRNLDAEFDNILSAAAANNASAAYNFAAAALKGVETDTAKKIQKSVVEKAFQEVESIKDNRELNWIRENREERGEGKRFGSPVGQYQTSRGYHSTVRQNKRQMYRY